MLGDGEGRTMHRSRWITILLVLVLLAAFVALCSWSLRVYATMAEKNDLRRDRLARQLQQFRDETSSEKRVDLLHEFARIQDPRVVVALMEAVQGELAKGRYSAVLEIASSLLVYYHIPKEELVGSTKYWSAALIWWEKNEADVRRRAAALPQ